MPSSIVDDCRRNHACPEIAHSLEAVQPRERALRKDGDVGFSAAVTTFKPAVRVSRGEATQANTLVACAEPRNAQDAQQCKGRQSTRSRPPSLLGSLSRQHGHRTQSQHIRHAMTFPNQREHQGWSHLATTSILFGWYSYQSACMLAHRA